MVTVRASPRSRSSKRRTATQARAVGLPWGTFGYIQAATLTNAKGPKSAQIAWTARPDVMFPHR